MHLSQEKWVHRVARGGDSMPEFELNTLKPLRKFLIEHGGHVKMRRLAPEKAEMRRRR